jgi:hypothetical protein
MKEEYDFSQSVKNPYSKKLTKQEPTGTKSEKPIDKSSQSYH